MAFEKVRIVEYDYQCLSSDTKPAVKDQETCYETNTGKGYWYDARSSEWIESFDTPSMPLWCDEQTIGIVSNAINIKSMAKTIVVTLTPETGTSDSVATVTGLKAGQDVIFKTGTAGHTITLTEGTTISASLGDSVLSEVSETWGGYFNGTNIIETFRP